MNHPPYKQMLVGMGLVLVSPHPPVSCSPLSHPPSHLPPWSSSQVVIVMIVVMIVVVIIVVMIIVNTHPPHEQLLMGMGRVLGWCS